jgi:hypothetical protein
MCSNKHYHVLEVYVIIFYPGDDKCRCLVSDLFQKLFIDKEMVPGALVAPVTYPQMGEGSQEKNSHGSSPPHSMCRPLPPSPYFTTTFISLLSLFWKEWMDFREVTLLSVCVAVGVYPSFNVSLP